MHLAVLLIRIYQWLVCLSELKVIITHWFVDSIIDNSIVISQCNLDPINTTFLRTAVEKSYIVKIYSHIIVSVFFFWLIKLYLLFSSQTKISLVKVNLVYKYCSYLIKCIFIGFILTIIYKLFQKLTILHSIRVPKID